MTGLDLAVIGNCYVAALIDRRGTIVWCCQPHLADDPVFCNLLLADDKHGGAFAIELIDLADARQEYLGNTAIVATTLTDKRGATLRIVDFAPRFKQYERIFRPGLLVRRIEPLSGAPRIRVRVRPRFAYGSIEAMAARGSNHVRYSSGIVTLRLTTDMPVSYVLEEAPMVLDAPVTLVFGQDETPEAGLAGLGREFQERTADYWHEWSRYLSVPFDWQDAVIRAAITLKLCSYEETGAIVAALTTSIPEAAHTPRNWDYRCCWLRDAYFVVHALNRLGATRTMEDFIRYITNVAAMEPDGRLKPVYGVVPGMDLREWVADALPGYRGMGPVRVGNQAAEQIQNDSYGSVVLAAAQMFFDRRLPARGDAVLYARLERLAETASQVALEPDAGLWEFRGRRRIHTHSAVMCWAACHRLGKIAAKLGFGEKAQRWRDEADRLRRAILEGAWSEKRGCFTVAFGSDELDASLLILHEVGFLRPDDPRFAATVDAVARDLVRDGYVYRYTAPDDFGVPETAFTVCSFWYVDALAALGRREAAVEAFERLVARRNALGLMSEDIDTRTGELWGNYPQSYSMVGLIISAMRLSKSWEEAFWRGS